MAADREGTRVVPLVKVQIHSSPCAHVLFCLIGETQSTMIRRPRTSDGTQLRGDSSSAQRNGPSASTSRHSSPRWLCSNTCFTAFNDMCDDGGLHAGRATCLYGSDCGDCGVRNAADTAGASRTHRSLADHSLTAEDLMLLNSTSRAERVAGVQGTPLTESSSPNFAAIVANPRALAALLRLNGIAPLGDVFRGGDSGRSSDDTSVGTNVLAPPLQIGDELLLSRKGSAAVSASVVEAASGTQRFEVKTQLYCPLVQH